MTDKTKPLNCEIENALSDFEKDIYVDNRAQVTKLVALANHLSRSNVPRESIAFALQSVIRDSKDRSGKWWSGIDYLIEILRLDKNSMPDAAALNSMLFSLIGKKTPTDSAARYFLIRAFQHSGGILQPATIRNEEKHFTTAYQAFWLRLFIDDSQADKNEIANKVSDFYIRELIDVGQLISLAPALHKTLGNFTFPRLITKLIRHSSTSGSKNALSKIYEVFMKAPPTPYLFDRSNPSKEILAFTKQRIMALTRFSPTHISADTRERAAIGHV